MLLHGLHLIGLICQLLIENIDLILKSSLVRIGAVAEAEDEDQCQRDAPFQQIRVWGRRWRRCVGGPAFFLFQTKHGLSFQWIRFIVTVVDYPRFPWFRRESCAIGETYSDYDTGTGNLPAGEPHSTRMCLIIRRCRPNRGYRSA